MLPIHTILHPTDFSDRSEYAFRLACALAHDHASQLVVRDKGVVLQDCVRTYYAKRLAQQAVMEASGLPILTNEEIEGS